MLDQCSRKIISTTLLLAVQWFESVGAEPQKIPTKLPTEVLGTWRQLDDGRYLHLTDSIADFFDYTPEICYRVEPDSGKALHESFDHFSLDEKSTTLKLWKYDFGERFERFYYTQFVRVDRLPKETLFAPSRDKRFKNPKFVASLITQQFDGHFPFFEQRKFDWEQRKRDLLNKINETSTDRELFTALCDSLTGLGDSHTRIYWTEEKQPFKSGRTRVLNYLEEAHRQQEEIESVAEFGGYWQRKMRKEIEDLLVVGEMRYAANDRIRWGVLKGNVGYIENEFLTGFAAPGTHRREEIRLLEKELDRVILALADCDALILDLSYNAGGFDQAAMTFASRFADKRRHVMSYHAPGIPRSLSRKCFVRPAGKTQFTKPVYVLTSNSTVSAGEALTMALKAFPHVRQVGEPTRGCTSSFLNKWMPNDFHLTLSNEVWSSPDGNIPEGKGLQPDTEISVFTRDDFFGSYPKAIQAVVEIALEQKSK